MSDPYGVRLNAEIARETRGMIARDSLLHDGKPSLSGIYAQRLARVYPGLRAEKCPDGNHWHVEAQEQPASRYDRLYTETDRSLP